MPEADMLIHSGDVGMDGTVEEIVDFLNWFLDLPFRNKIFVPGNHDLCLLDAKVDGLDSNCFLLSSAGVEIDGLKIYGVPMFVAHMTTNEYEENILSIPADTDILITHQPPYGILDYAKGNNYGSLTLLEKVKEIRPKYHLFGHVHGGYGQIEKYGVEFCNASLMDEKYNMVNQPILLK